VLSCCNPFPDSTREKDINVVPSNTVASGIVLSTAVRGSRVPGSFISDQSGASTSQRSSPSDQYQSFYE